MVSVITPAYNSQQYIEETIASVMSQNYPNWEHIIIDDCSTDATLSVIKKMAQKDSRIQVVENRKNRGVAATRNKGIAKARGKYVALLDGDDLWNRDKLEKQVQIAEDTGASIVYTSYEMIDDKGNKRYDDYMVPKTIDLQGLLEKNVLSCSTTMLRKDVAEKYCFSNDFYHEDYALWIQLVKAGYQPVGITEPLAKYRIHQGSRASNKVKSAYHRWKIYRKLAHCSIPQSNRFLWKYATAGMKKYRKKQ